MSDGWFVDSRLNSSDWQRDRCQLREPYLAAALEEAEKILSVLRCHSVRAFPQLVVEHGTHLRTSTKLVRVLDSSHPLLQAGFDLLEVLLITVELVKELRGVPQDIREKSVLGQEPASKLANGRAMELQTMPRHGNNFFAFLSVRTLVAINCRVVTFECGELEVLVFKDDETERHVLVS